jgi:hypothetical protein
MSIKVSHELPINALHLSRKINDYEYCLPHLLDESKEYRRFFYGAKSDGRYIIMDNSIHELGEAYDRSRLLYWIDELEPNEFIVPDVWEDKTGTLVSAKEWSSIDLPKGVEKVAVVQAKSYSEGVECYNILKTQGYHKLSFSYGAEWYGQLVDNLEFLSSRAKKAYGRFIFISQLYYSGVISSTDNVHLLGCNLPQEYGWYRNFPFIKSVDTSNPVMAALEDVRYWDFGLLDKPKASMNDEFDSIDEDLIIYNAKKFREINGFDPLSA